LKPSTLNNRSEEEIRAIQEKKNQTDFIYQTNQRLQNLDSSIVSLSVLIEKRHADLCSNHKSLQIDLENHKENVSDILNQFSSKIDETNIGYVYLDQKCDKSIKSMMESLMHLSDVGQSVEEIDLSHDALFLDLQAFKSESSSAVDLIKSQMTHDLACLREDFKKEASIVDPTIDALKQEINVLLNEIAGLKKDVAYLKHDKCFMERKIERLQSRSIA
jgi:hypothetical protein